MSKKPVVYIPASVIEQVVAASGLPVKELSGWLMVGRFGTKGPRLYIPRLKTVGRVDLVGLDDCEGAISPHLLGLEPHGAVTSMLDTRDTRTVDEVLADLAGMLEALATLPALPPRTRGPRKPKDEPETQAPEAILARVALIKRVAAEKGASVHASVLSNEEA